MIIQYIRWNVNPTIFHLPFAGMEIRWYGLLFAMAFILGYYLMLRFFKKEGLTVEMLDKLTVYMAVGTIVGARLGHCLFYQPDYYFENPLEILMIWKGGLASHGAGIGILIALFLYARKVEKPYLWILDRIAIVVALAGFFIRMGNLLNSEIYGVGTRLPWGFIFVRNNETIPKHPTQIYEALAYLLFFGLLIFLYYKNNAKIRKGMLFSLFLFLVFTARFLIEFIKEAQVPFEQYMALNMGQILSIPFILAGIFLFFRALKNEKA